MSDNAHNQEDKFDESSSPPVMHVDDGDLRTLMSYGKDAAVDDILVGMSKSKTRKVTSVMKRSANENESKRLIRNSSAKEPLAISEPSSVPTFSKQKTIGFKISSSNVPPLATGEVAQGEMKLLLRKGYLEKQGGTFKTWKVRYFHLFMRPKYFLYFEDVEAATASPKGSAAPSSNSSPAQSSSDLTKLDSDIVDEKSEDLLPHYHKHLVVDPAQGTQKDAIKMISLDDEGITVTKTGMVSFEVKTKNRDWQFRATSRDNLEQWMRAFEFVISGECDNFINQVQALENLIRSISYLIKFNQKETESVGWLSSQDAIFVTSKLQALQNMQKFFDETYGFSDDLIPIQEDAKRAILRAKFACEAILIRTELHDLVAVFDRQLEATRQLIDESAKGNAVAKEAANELWQLTVKHGRAIIGNSKFETFIKGCTRDDCRYLDDRDLFVEKFKEAEDEMKAKLSEKRLNKRTSQLMRQ
jgi:hypothetical protein